MSKLLNINVNEHVEKKNNLSYLSWAWAWAEVLKLDANATWEAVEHNGLPCVYLKDDSAMVKVNVTISGHTKSCTLPVMNHKNQAIKNPDAFAVNTAIVRCLTKCIALFGLGLYIYAGEDLPEADKPEPFNVQDSIRILKSAPNLETLTAYFKAEVSKFPPSSQDYKDLKAEATAQRKYLESMAIEGAAA